MRSLLIIVLIFPALLITACVSTPAENLAVDTLMPSLTPFPIKTFAPTPAGTSTPTLLENLQASDPDFEIRFNDQGCTVFGPKEISPGEYLVVLRNETDRPASLWMENYFGGGSFENHLRWREENCGGQGTHCEDEDGNLITYNLVAWMYQKLQAKESEKIYYKVYEVKLAREHSFWVSMDGGGWLCAPIQVVK